MLGRRKQAGDTLIEVMFAVTVFSAVIVGALTIMNQGAAAAQRSLEITLVRQQVDSQADTLRFMHDSYVSLYRPGISFAATDQSPAAQWYRMTRSSQAVANADAYNGDSATCPEAPSKSFIIDPRKAAYISSASSKTAAKSFAQVTYRPDGSLASEGIWIQAVQSAPSSDRLQANVGYIDFHIRACWDGPGNGPMLKTGTIVRLYEPR